MARRCCGASLPGSPRRQLSIDTLRRHELDAVQAPIRTNDEVDREGIRVAVGNKSAYDLFLSRELKKAKLERAPTSPVVVDYFLANNLDVAAGVKQQLETDAKRLGNLRLLPGRFMVINQAMGIAKGKDAGARYLTAFVEEMKASGFVAEALKRHDIEGASVAPPGGAPRARTRAQAPVSVPALGQPRPAPAAQ